LAVVCSQFFDRLVNIHIGAVDIRPRVSGYIDRIAFKEGDMVKAGDLLFVVDPRPLYVAGCLANKHICWAARRTVSLLRPFGE
jgi:multidrug resistance efflux pump